MGPEPKMRVAYGVWVIIIVPGASHVLSKELATVASWCNRGGAGDRYLSFGFGGGMDNRKSRYGISRTGPSSPLGSITSKYGGG